MELKGAADSDSTEINAYYDDWAGKYNTDILAWGYDAPGVAARLLAESVNPDAPVLDVGCGTGLTGQALKAAGFSNITGIDFSEPSLELAAQTGAYESLVRVDLTKLPSSLPDGQFGGLICIGVMSYLPEIEPVCREFCRLLAPGATAILTQRSDLFVSRNTQAAFDALVTDGLWEIISISEPGPYLPDNAEFDGIGAHYCVFRKAHTA